jgi:hypothetical protein
LLTALEKEENLPETDKISYYLFQAEHLEDPFVFNIIFVQDPTTSSEEGGDDNNKSAPPLLATAAQLHLERGECGAVAAGGPDHRPPKSTSPCGVEKISSI